MDVKEYTMKDREGNDKKLSEMFGDKEHLILIIIWKGLFILHNVGRRIQGYI